MYLFYLLPYYNLSIKIVCIEIYACSFRCLYLLERNIKSIALEHTCSFGGRVPTRTKYVVVFLVPLVTNPKQTHMFLQGLLGDWLSKHICQHFSRRYILESDISWLQPFSNIIEFSNEVFVSFEWSSLVSNNDSGLVVLSNNGWTDNRNAKFLAEIASVYYISATFVKRNEFWSWWCSSLWLLLCTDSYNDAASKHSNDSSVSISIFM